MIALPTLRELPSWTSRVAALGLLVAVIGGLYGFVVAPLIQAYDESLDALAQARAMVTRYEGIARQRDDLEVRLSDLRDKQAASGVYLLGDTDALAAASLQERVNATIESTGGKLRSIQILPSISDGGFQRVSVRVQLTGTTRTLFDILYALEADRTHLFIENLDVRNRRARRRATVEDDDPELTIRFDLTGYLRPEIG